MHKLSTFVPFEKKDKAGQAAKKDFMSITPSETFKEQFLEVELEGGDDHLFTPLAGRGETWDSVKEKPVKQV